jgi:hypothetical protein
MIDNILYGFPVSNTSYSSLGLFDILILVVIFYFYLRLPLRQINLTYNMMRNYRAYGEDPISWRQRIVKKYWKVPFVTVVVMVVSSYIAFNYELPTIIREWSAYIICVGCPFLLLFWPLKIWREAKVEQVTMEHCRQEDLEHRIASGMASSRDIRGYMQGVKKREYEKGYWDGCSRRTSTAAPRCSFARRMEE